jgi:hypothetical protein
MGESDVASLVAALAASSPREAYDLVVANPWLLESGVVDTIGSLLTTARRQGDGARAERLERGRRMLQRCSEYGADRVLVGEVLDRLEALSSTELAGAVHIAPAEDLQAELRRRIDGSIAIGDVLAWNHWLTVSIALEHAGGPDPLQATPAGAVGGEAERDVLWAAQFLHEHDVDTQRALLRDGALPLPRSRLGQVLLRFRAEHLMAARERDALRVIHLRRSLAMAQVTAEADQDPDLAEEVLAGRQIVIVEGAVL